MEAKFTSGKFSDGNKGWKAVEYPSAKKIGLSTHEIHFSDDGECVAEIVHGEADAKLIAAAPDMFEALAEAKLQIEYLHGKFSETGTGNSVLSKINSAIQKATA